MTSVSTTNTTAAHLNGVDVTALNQAIEGIAQMPAAGMLGFRVSTEWQNGTRARTRVDDWSVGGETRSRGFTIEADEPHELCGSNTNPNPQELLMAAVNSCIMVGIVLECCRRGVQLRSLRLDTEGELDLRGFLGIDPAVVPGYDAVRLKVHLQADGPESLVREAFDAAMRGSPNRWNITMPVRLDPQLVMQR